MGKIIEGSISNRKSKNKKNKEEAEANLGIDMNIGTKKINIVHKKDIEIVIEKVKKSIRMKKVKMIKSKIIKKFQFRNKRKKSVKKIRLN